jgi:general secretion pathway protein D
MKVLKRLGLLTLILGTTFCAGSQAFREAREEETLQHWDVAVLRYSRAQALDPGNAAYKIALQRARIKASQFHFEKGKVYRSSGRPELAVIELQQAVVLDPTNQYAETELKKAREEAQKLAVERSGDTRLEELKKKTRGARARSPILEPASDKPINLNFPQPLPIKKIYQALASAAGVNVIFDPQLKDDNVSIVLTNMSFQHALETLMRQENHFYKVIDEKSILIAADTPANRKTYEDLVLRTFYLSNGDITDVSNALRNLLQTTRIYPNKAENSITLRDTADKVAIAEKIIEQNDKQLAEVVVDVELLQINTTKTQDLGLLLTPYVTNAAAPAPGGKADNGATLAAGSFSWDQLRNLSIRSFGFTIPSVAYNFIKNNTNAELLAKPQLRISEGQKAQLIIGDRVPIPTTTFNTGTTVGGNIVPVTSFQYQDVGIKIEVEPRVHHNKEVTMKLAVEVSSLNGTITVQQGQDQPIIATRTISSNIRLKDGETNFLAGLFRNDKSNNTDTVPFLGDIPVLGRLLSRKKTTNNATDIVLTLTPHIIRIPDITEEDLAPLYVGTDQNISFGATPRIETPGTVGPFDSLRQQPTPPPAAGKPTPGPVNLVPIAPPPSDIFRSPREAVPPQPQPTPVPRPFGESIAASPGISFDFNPSSLVLPRGQQRSVLVQVTGEETMANTSIAVRFDPAVVAAVLVRPILSDAGVADAHIESGRVVIDIPSSLALSGTRAVAEITLLGVGPGKTALAFEKPPADIANRTDAVIEVK